MKQYPYIVFCDFDGTVTNFETAEGLWALFLGKSAFEKKLAQLVADNHTTSYGIKELFGMIKSTEYPKVLEYLKTITIRPGFGEFLEFLKAREIPFVLVSGGIREMVDYALTPYRDLVEGVYCCDLSCKQEYFTISSAYDDGVDLLRKELVMQEYSYDQSIFLGDSFTDRNAGLSADIVFARDRLDSFLTEKEVAHYSFETFFDVMKKLEALGCTNREEGQ